jgi:hypothetical protein
MRFHFDFNMRKASLLVALASGAMLVGCTPTASEQSGELGNGDFLYPCDTSTINCDASGHDADYGASASSFYVASGGKFKIDFQRPSNKADIDSVNPIAKAIINKSPDGFFTANREGWGGYVAMNPGGQIVDFSEVQIKKVGSMKLNAHSNGSFTADQNDFQTLTIQLQNGTDQPTFNLLANLYSANSYLLHGEVPLDWSVTDPTVANLTNMNGHIATITGLKKGTTMLTVTGAGLTRTASVEVQ